MGKRNARRFFEEYPHMLCGIGSDGSIDNVEEFVCRLYGAPNPLAGVNQCRVDLFDRGSKELDKLPPTKDSLTLHLIRCNFQAKVWLQATTQFQKLCLPVDTGYWKVSNAGDNLQIVWASLPSIPSCCLSLISCG